MKVIFLGISFEFCLESTRCIEKGVVELLRERVGMGLEGLGALFPLYEIYLPCLIVTDTEGPS